MTTSTSNTTTIVNAAVAGQNRQETADDLTAFLNAQDAGTTVKVTEVTEKETPKMNTTATTIEETTTLTATYALKLGDAQYPGGVIRVIGEEYCPVIYTTGNLDILENNNKIAIIGSTRMDNNVLKSAAEAIKILAGNGATIVLGNAAQTDFDTDNSNGNTNYGLISRVLVDTKAPLILILAKGMNEEMTEAFNEYLAEGRLLILSLIDPQELDRSGNKKSAKRRVALVASISDSTLIMQAGPESSGSWSSIMQALRSQQPVYALNIERLEFNKDLIENWGVQKLPKRDQWNGTIIR